MTEKTERDREGATHERPWIICRITSCPAATNSVCSPQAAAALSVGIPSPPSFTNAFCRAAAAVYVARSSTLSTILIEGG